MRTSAIAGAIIISYGLAWAPSASAEIIFLGGASRVDAYASAWAGGAAYAIGEETAAAAVWMTSLADTQAFSVNQGLGGSYSAGLGQAEGEFAGVSKSFTSLAGGPTTVTSVAETTKTARNMTTAVGTELEAFESLTAVAADYQDMSVEFASSSSATFVFTGDANASLAAATFARASSTLPTTTTLVIQKQRSRTTPGESKTLRSRTPSTTLTERTNVTTTRASKIRPRAVVTGYVGAEAASDNSYIYTFEVVGNPKETLAVAYATSAAFDGLVAYDITLINATTGAYIGRERSIDANADGVDFLEPSIDRRLFAHRERNLQC